MYKYVPTKPLYMLIKVEVDKEIVYNQDKAEHMQTTIVTRWSMHYVDWYYPDDEQYPYIANDEDNTSHSADYKTLPYIILFTYLITNFFIIAGVTRHWIRYDNTQLAAPQQEAAQIQEKTTNDTGCQKRTKI